MIYLRNILLYVSIFLLSSTAFAFECNPEGNQSKMNQCAYDDFLKADKALNDVYQQLIKKSKGDKTYIKQLRKAQRAWIVFRDAELDAMFSCAEEDIKLCWGSMVGMLYPSAKAELTEERTKKLQHYLDNGQNDVGEG
jgi:uncharacterized protein YecT (DUF1311 family)